jgi:NAD(P)-dependent dehydrogenase (short-subunit alcohol dehydrogenase family)
MTQLTSHRFVITGGTGGLGEAVVRRLAELGAVCEVTFRNSAEAEPLRNLQRVRLHALDVSDETAVVKFYAQFPDLWASLHLVGAFTMAPIEKTTLADMRKMFEINTMSCFVCCREAISAIRRAARGGRIVNVAARPAVIPTADMIAYSTSKAAVASMTQSLAEELKAENILVNAVLPSVMDTPANRRAMPNADFSKWPSVQEVAETMAFLASPVNALTSGALVPVYGRA